MAGVTGNLAAFADEQNRRRRQKSFEQLCIAGYSKELAGLFLSMLDDIPSFNGPTKKFEEGIVRWIIEGQFDLSNQNDKLRLTKLLKVLAGSPAYDVFDKNFVSELTQQPESPESVANTINVDLESCESTANANHSYDVVKISTYSDLTPYANFGKNWCISNSETVFYEYLQHGSANMYLCLRDDYKTVVPTPGDTFPHDNYGLSMIVVIVSGGKVISVTSRWNDCFEGDEFFADIELRKVLGEKFVLLK